MPYRAIVFKVRGYASVIVPQRSVFSKSPTEQKWRSRKTQRNRWLLTHADAVVAIHRRGIRNDDLIALF
jgi:hypothetical protein